MKTTEVVMGLSTYACMRESKILSQNKIINFDVVLSLADLSMTNDYKIMLSKEIFFKEQELCFKNEIAKLEESIKNKEKIRLWTSHKEINVYLLFLYLCNFLLDKDCEFYVVFSDEYKEECYSPSCMVYQELELLLKLEHKVTCEEIKKYSLEWSKIKEVNSDMRIIENDTVKSVSFDYYNEFILNKLKEMGEVKEIELIVELMMEFHMSDTVFIYLVDRLIKENKIKIVKKDESNSTLNIIAVNI